MKKLHWKKIVIAGFWYLVIATIFRQIEIVFTMEQYQDPAYFGVWSRLMMPVEGRPPAGFFVISTLFTYVTGCTLAAVYDFIKGLFGKGFWGKVIGFTDITVGLAIVFGYFPMYVLFNVPLVLLAWWLGASWATIFVSSMMFVNVMKR